MRTQKSRRVAYAFESLEGRALMAIYMKVDGVDGRVVAQQVAEVHIATPPITPTGLLLPAVQKVREAAVATGGVRVAMGDITG